MVHLRIVVPSYQAEHALDLLSDTPSAVNLIYLERAAHRPEGDEMAGLPIGQSRRGAKAATGPTGPTSK
jgi:hypothetical protein